MVDGDLSDSAWQYGPGLGVFGESKGKVAIPGDTEIKTLFADGTLYIAAAVEEPDMVGQSRRVIERDDYVEDEDHLVIFIDADPETRGYARIAVNAAGTLNDRLVATSKSQEEEISWDGVSEVAAEQGENTWRVEMAIPLKDLGWDGETRRIGFNIWQGRARDHKVSRRHWQPLLEHDVDSFGVLVLPD
jgi:hypothetical protein